MDQNTVRRRLQLLRNRKGISQAVLSEAMGFKDRQTLSNIEKGHREISETEVLKASQFLGISVNFFTDPLELGGEACFSWRKSAAQLEDVQSFEDKAGRWIATYRHLKKLKGESVNSLLTQVGLDRDSSFVEAALQGEAVSKSFDLGPVPFDKLIDVIENKLDTLVLYVDTLPGISGAACQLGPLNVILINRTESVGRRSFDIGHELFHLFTWHEMPPQHIEDTDEKDPAYKKVEALANSFASGLLLPEYALIDYIKSNNLPSKKAEYASWIKACATHFKVSGQTVKWRLRALSYISAQVANQLQDDELRLEFVEEQCPPRFSKRFVELLGWGLENGYISIRKASKALDINIDDLSDLFEEHNLEIPFAL